MIAAASLVQVALALNYVYVGTSHPNHTGDIQTKSETVTFQARLVNALDNVVVPPLTNKKSGSPASPRNFSEKEIKMTTVQPLK